MIKPLTKKDIEGTYLSIIPLMTNPQPITLNS